RANLTPRLRRHEAISRSLRLDDRIRRHRRCGRCSARCSVGMEAMSAFKPSSETGQQTFAKILFWGPPGAGKTHTALTWPEPALVDMETRGRNFANRFV